MFFDTEPPNRPHRTASRFSALDFSSLGLTFNLQLSTFNRVSFPASHLSLSQRSSKSFTIRTSETPLTQLLYNPHLRAPLGSAGNKGLITPLESALTKNSPVSLLESALTKRWGVGPASYRMVSISASRETWVAGKPLIENFWPPDSEK